MNLAIDKKTMIISCIVYSFLTNNFFDDEEKIHNDEYTVYNMMLLLSFVLLFVIGLISLTVYDYYFNEDPTRSILENIYNELHGQEEEEQQQQEKNKKKNKETDTENEEKINITTHENDKIKLKYYISVMFRLFLGIFVTYILSLFFSDLVLFFIILFVFIMYRNNRQKIRL